MLATLRLMTAYVAIPLAETKGSMSSMELREIEKTKTKCARKFFDEINRKISPSNVKYDVVDSYEKLMRIVTS